MSGGKLALRFKPMQGLPLDVIEYIKSTQPLQALDNSSEYISFPCSDSPSDIQMTSPLSHVEVSLSGIGFDKVDQTVAYSNLRHGFVQALSQVADQRPIIAHSRHPISTADDLFRISNFDFNAHYLACCIIMAESRPLRYASPEVILRWRLNALVIGQTTF